jgi:hypothetical protein
MIANLLLFAEAILKCALYTGLGPAALLISVFMRFYREPRKAQVIPFPQFQRWGERTAPATVQANACYVGAGARPLISRKEAARVRAHSL